MARPLRIEVPGGRYHMRSRGNEGRAIFRDDRDRAHMLQLLEEIPERFGTRVHSYVLMPNHYHLLIETPEANLSRVGQWLNVSYSTWFNGRHGRTGHLFQGRFAAVLIEDDDWFLEVGRYIHLNPVRVARLGLGKRERAAARAGLSPAPNVEVVRERMRVLREFVWSSYPAYAGYRLPPEWLTMEPLGSLCGGRTVKEQRAAHRRHVEEAVREGLAESPWEHVIGGVVLGSVAFAGKVARGIRADGREQSGIRTLKRPVPWGRIVRAVEGAKKEKWIEFRDRHDDWGRDAALWLGRHQGRMKLTELAQHAGGIHYAAAGAAVSRFGRRLRENRALREQFRNIQERLSKNEI